MYFRLSFLLLACLSFNNIFAQCISGNCENGFGKYKFKNEDVYEGNWKNSSSNGKGKRIYSNGDVFEGDWVNGYWNGKGKYTWKDGRV